MKKNPSLQFTIPASAHDRTQGKKVAIIGGTGGLGRALARELASHGAQVLVVGQTFRDAGTANIDFIRADLSLMSEARRVAALIPAESLDLLVFTTGIFAAPERQVTAEGIERDLAVSYLNRLVMLESLGPRLGLGRAPDAERPRVFLMGFPGSGQNGAFDDLNAERSYSAMTVHMNTVAGNEMLVLDGARRWPNAEFHGLNPGLVKTGIRDNYLGRGSLKSRLVESLIGLLTPTPQAYARRIAPLLVAPQLAGHSGVLFNRKGEVILPSPGLTPEHMRAFTAAAQQIVAEHAAPGSPGDAAGRSAPAASPISRRPSA